MCLYRRPVLQVAPACTVFADLSSAYSAWPARRQNYNLQTPKSWKTGPFLVLPHDSQPAKQARAPLRTLAGGELPSSAPPRICTPPTQTDSPSRTADASEGLFLTADASSCSYMHTRTRTHTHTCPPRTENPQHRSMRENIVSTLPPSRPRRGA